MHVQLPLESYEYIVIYVHPTEDQSVVSVFIETKYITFFFFNSK